MKKILALLVVSLLLCSCSVTGYRTYYQNGQVQQEYQRNSVLGILDEPFLWLGGIFTLGFGPRSNSYYYYTCPGH